MLTGNVVLRKRLNYEDKTRYFVIIQANVSIHSPSRPSWELRNKELSQNVSVLAECPLEFVASTG